ncbi:efflux RND transporter periplasmic adaptor subunit [Thiorhodovibrio frisius]|uniref:RND family efflux transporter, MFP subunit n=1 Tax=Thiorhodovibrio frisius TaxID=631362 RepID=H8Z370_9GAMM|nr:efflux RND transporter periplasmic adaptor subunit [Thiorhodovibrio frisius]EIC21778.1 RND family efflux transporter, MFP subunit [Thiorhodovibrio frisius]WPL21745.1 Cation efflux system protein CzcB [Thiorhodovibrio frisius]
MNLDSRTLRPQHHLRVAQLALTAALLSGAAAALAADIIPIDATQRRAFGIQLTAPEGTDETRSRRYPARVTVPNPQLRVVSAPQDGILVALLVAEGERVVAGQALAELRSPGLVDLQSAFLEASTRLELASSELERDQRLARDGLIAERRLFETRARQRELTTTVEQQRQRLAIAGLSDTDIATLRDSRQLGSTLPIRAPLAGVVLEQMVATGESVAAATPLYRIAELDPLWLEVHVPVDDLAGLTIGGRAWLPELERPGTIITIGRMVHERDQGVLVRVEVTDSSGRLRPGQFIEVQLTAAGTGWQVPVSALVRQGDRAYLFVARPEGFAAVPVTVLSEQDGRAMIAAELTPEDRIATRGTVALKAIWLGGEGSGGGE